MSHLESLLQDLIKQNEELEVRCLDVWWVRLQYILTVIHLSLIFMAVRLGYILTAIRLSLIFMAVRLGYILTAIHLSLICMAVM